MKRNLKNFVLMAVIATLFTACNWAPEGNGWDYKNVKENSQSNPQKIVSGSKFKGTGYITKSSGSGDWWFINETDTALKCKYAEKLSYKGTSEFQLLLPNSTGTGYTYSSIENKKEFEIPAGAMLRIMAGSSYRITSQSSGNSDKFFQFYLACH